MTVPKFPTAKEAHDAGWFSRRHETRYDSLDAQAAHGHYESQRTARRRRALQRHEANLAEYEAQLSSLTDPAALYPEEWSEDDWQQEKYRLGYKIRTTKRAITGARKNLGLEEEYAVKA